jgi:hypothetical protein
MPMAGPAESREPWERLAAELRAYGQAQRQAWGDIDDIQLAGYLAGACSPSERAAVEQAIRDLPDVREVIDLLRSILPALEVETPAPPGSEGATSQPAAPPVSTLHETVVHGQAADVRQALRGWTPWRAALVGFGLAASFLLGLLIGQGRLGPEAPLLLEQSQSGPSRATHRGPGEVPQETTLGPKSPDWPLDVLLASLTAVPRDSRAGESARVTLNDRRVYRITGGRDFALEIRSPLPGVATLVLLGAGQAVVYPLPGQAPIAVAPFEPRKFGPLDRLEARTTVLVVVTAAPAAETVRKYLAGTEAALNDPDLLLAQLERPLWLAGQRWVARGRITVEPLEKP